VKQPVLAALQGRGFDHVLEQLRRNRENETAKQPIIDELTAAGVNVMDRPCWTDPVKPLAASAGTGDPSLSRRTILAPVTSLESTRMD
jgi:hypothetical protein